MGDTVFDSDTKVSNPFNLGNGVKKQVMLQCIELPLTTLLHWPQGLMLDASIISFAGEDPEAQAKKTSVSHSLLPLQYVNRPCLVLPLLCLLWFRTTELLPLHHQRTFREGKQGPITVSTLLPRLECRKETSVVLKSQFASSVFSLLGP